MKLKGPLKVTVWLAGGMRITPEGLKYDDVFIDRQYDMEEYFRERIILPINDLAGNSWAVSFTEYPVREQTYFVDITADDAYLRPIINIISEAFPEVNLDFWKPVPRYTLLAKHYATVG